MLRAAAPTRVGTSRRWLPSAAISNGLPPLPWGHACFDGRPPAQPAAHLPWKALWGKWGFANDDHVPESAVAVHPLFCHMVDLAAVAESLWQEVFTQPTRQPVADRLGVVSVDAAVRWTSFFAGSHGPADGAASIGGLRVRLDTEQGLVIEARQERQQEDDE